MNKIENIEEIFRLLKKGLKKYKSPFESKDMGKRVLNTPFTTLISCILSLRTRDEVTSEAALRLLERYNTPEKISKLSDKEIESLIYPVGFYKTKAKRIKEISKVLIDKYNGNVPDSFEELIKLKGVGPKTANVVMAYGFKKKGYLPIDTHCHRIPNRLGWIETKTPEETEKKLKELLPKKYLSDFNHLFVKFGQTICLPISPLCSKCPIEKFCKKVGVERSR